MWRLDDCTLRAFCESPYPLGARWHQPGAPWRRPKGTVMSTLDRLLVDRNQLREVLGITLSPAEIDRREKRQECSGSSRRAR